MRLEDLFGFMYERICSPDVKLQEKIERRGSKWVVLNSDGTDVLGKHDTEKEAKAQLAAIEISKKERGEK